MFKKLPALIWIFLVAAVSASPQAVPTGAGANAATAASAKTRYAETGGRRIAYRSIGRGEPVILCNRFRGIMDSWDPAFLDELARTRRVITFDYTGLGLSTGSMGTGILDYARDVRDLAASLGLSKAVVVGWSFGGIVAQSAAIEYPGLVTHAVLIGTNPPGRNAAPAEAIFVETSSKVENSLADETILFFEPRSPASTRAAAESRARILSRKADLSVPVPEKLWGNYLAAAAAFADDAPGYRERLGRLGTPLLVISGDHDIVCPIENWYALTRKMPNLQIVMLPDSGHGPQHQYPKLSVALINAFLDLR